MSDSSQLLNNNVGVSDDVMYDLKTSAVRSRAYRCSVPSSNKPNFTMSGQEQCMFKIPCGRRATYLQNDQSYLKYTVINQDVSSSFFFDSHGSCIINRIDVFSGSNVIAQLSQ